MNIKSIRLIGFMAALLMGSSGRVSAAETPPEDAAITNKLITAVVQSDYDAFVADGEATFRQLKKEQFQAATARLAPRLQAGHEVSYLGELKQNGYHVTLWKITFKDGSDDALATLSMKAGKVGG